jgi:hypothetical protein
MVDLGRRCCDWDGLSASKSFCLLLGFSFVSSSLARVDCHDRVGGINLDLCFFGHPRK